ncbi:MAG TPA: MerR family transcriptional regulator [Phototrophicaceae bacterium]|nr:MerR family transcriptional regulator [Phototrophicaceae bacterium]
MAEISINQVTQQTGVRPSALRYYEEIGLLRPTRRRGGRRQYDDSVLQRLALIQTGQQAGFTLAELGLLLNRVLGAESGGADWHELVERKLKEMEARLRHIESMKRLLTDIMDCDDDSLAECIVLLGQQHSLIQS